MAKVEIEQLKQEMANGATIGEFSNPGEELPQLEPYHPVRVFHEQVHSDLLGADVDHLLLETLENLNKLGYQTCYSCQGDSVHNGYIGFTATEQTLSLMKSLIGAHSEIFHSDPPEIFTREKIIFHKDNLESPVTFMLWDRFSRCVFRWNPCEPEQTEKIMSILKGFSEKAPMRNSATDRLVLLKEEYLDPSRDLMKKQKA